MTPWWRPRLGWLIHDWHELDGGRVHVTMVHPDWPEPLYIDAPDWDYAVAWTMIRRNGAVHWKPKAKRAPTPAPPSG
jgi:hypothetical protein